VCADYSACRVLADGTGRDALHLHGGCFRAGLDERALANGAGADSAKADTNRRSLASARGLHLDAGYSGFLSSSFTRWTTDAQRFV